MDLRLLALLIFSFCNQALSVAEEESHTLDVPLSSLMPTVPEKEPGTTPAPVTHDSRECFHPVTEPVLRHTLPTEDGDSSEELVEGGCKSYVSQDNEKKRLGSAIMDFGLKLLEKVESRAEMSNVVVSPLSISIALAQLALGAAGETESQILRSLQVDNLPCYHKAQYRLLRQLRGQAVQLASRLYLKPGFEVKPAFMKKSGQMYGSHPAPLTSLEDINEWVEMSTKGQVTNFLSELPSGLELMLINAIHFKGEWEVRFDPKFTSKDAFHIDNKHMVMVDMMHAPKYPLSILNVNELDAQVARFPFKGHMSLLVVKPTTGMVNVSSIMAHLNISELYAHSSRPMVTQVMLPKFKVEYSEELQEALSSMGLQELFIGPDLSGIADGPLLVNSVQHKSSLELSEEGVEMAAATSVAVLRSRSIFCLNQPFFFALVDDHTQVPIFLGVITNPNPGAPIELSRLAGSHFNNSDMLDNKMDGTLDDKIGKTMNRKQKDKMDGKMDEKVGPETHKGSPK